MEKLNIEINYQNKGNNSNNQKNFNLNEYFVNKYNSTIYNDGVYNCKICGNKGTVACLDENNNIIMKTCKCFNTRRNRDKLKQLGLLDFIDLSYSSQSDKIQDYWLEKTKRITKKYLTDLIENDKKYWLYIGGKTGSGKTSRCVFALARIMKANPDFTVEYFNWDTSYKELAFSKDKENLIDDLKNADVLYIDDFLRLQQPIELSKMERELAKMIIDYRYINKKITLISGELYLMEVQNLDEAIGSRIYQMTNQGKYMINIDRIKDRNLRLRRDLSDNEQV